jgi:hypothetical protein
MRPARMEYGLRLAEPADLPGDPRAACAPAWRELLPEGDAVALYFGSEFCEDRLPDHDEAAAFCALARECGLEPTLLTPLVTPEGLRSVGRLVDALAADDWQPTIVCNDWGVLGLMRDRHPSLPRRAGRLMNRSLRDPRAYNGSRAGHATHDAARCARLRQLLADFGVDAVETDADLDGGFLGEGAGVDGGGLGRALHLPFTFAASGRSCPVKAGLYPQGGGFAKTLADPCPAPCRGKPWPVSRPDTPLAHWRAGNTLFYEVPREAARSWLEHADRIVLHPTVTP